MASIMALGIAWGGLIVGAKWQYRLEYFPLFEALWISPRSIVGGGERLPLGMVTGGVLALLWCLATRAPWRATGDALAVAAFAMTAIGRLGCLLNGCCMGTVCGRWAAPLCLRYPPGTESYGEQLRAELIPASAPLSLPAHPLPLYFAATSLVILAVLVWLLRRNAPPGSLLATACILGPLGKVALEPLRADPRPPALMFGIPFTTLAVTMVLLLVRYGRAAFHRRALQLTTSELSDHSSAR